MKTGLAGSLALGLVFIPDRRGCGLSGPYSEHHGIEKECEDIHALINPGIIEMDREGAAETVTVLTELRDHRYDLRVLNQMPPLISHHVGSL
jgi:hypothetical protein